MRALGTPFTRTTHKIKLTMSPANQTQKQSRRVFCILKIITRITGCTCTYSSTSKHTGSAFVARLFLLFVGKSYLFDSLLAASSRCEKYNT